MRLWTRPLSAARPGLAPVVRAVRPVLAQPSPLRPFHHNAFLEAKATKGASGKKKGKKETFELPKDLTMDKIAADWSKWKHGDKRDVTLDFKPGEEPDWLKEIIATADKNGILHVLFPFSPSSK